MPSYRPTLAAVAPRGWYFKESITLLAPDGQANVIISGEPIDPWMDSADYAAVQGELLANEFPGYRQHRFDPELIFGGYPGFVRAFSWRPPDGVPVTQLQFYCAFDGRAYTGTATTVSTRFTERESCLRETLLNAMVEA